MEHQFLNSKISKLTDKKNVFASAVDGVDRPEFLEEPSGTAKFAENRPVQLHSIYRTGDIDIVPRIGIGNVEDRIGSLTDAHRLCIAEVRKRGLEDAVVVKHLDPSVAAIAGVDIALRVHRNTQNVGELAGACASFAPGLQKSAVLIELCDARVAGAIGDEYVACGVPCHVGGPVKEIGGLSRAISPLSAGRNELRLRFSSEKHRDVSLRVELHDHVAHLVDRPDIVSGIDAHLGGSHEPVGIFADLPHVLAGAIELEHPRTAMREGPHGADSYSGMSRACVDEDVALGIGSD